MAGFRGRVRHWGAVAIANPWAFLVTFAAGVTIAFLYSYIPLHNVKDRKIDMLSERVIALEGTIDDLEGTLETQREAAADAPDATVLASLEQERESGRAELKSAQSSLKKAEERIQHLERERGEWRRKVAALEKERDEVLTSGTSAALAIAPDFVEETDSERAAEIERAVAGAAPPISDSDSAAMPAAPAPSLADPMDSGGGRAPIE